MNRSRQTRSKDTSADLRGPTRVPLNRERILQAALDLADHEGLEALSMRKLAQALGVEAMSLYNHVANKDEILAGMVDVVFSEVELPETGDWKQAMRQRYLSTRDAFERHPWALGLLHSSRVPLGQATLRHHDEVLGRLRAAGFSLAAAAYACSVLDSYTYGFALRAQRLAFDSSKPPDDASATLIRQLTSQAYPNLAEVAVAIAHDPDQTPAREFAFGLDLILQGLDQHRDTT